MAVQAIKDGRAWDRFTKFIAAQDGDIEFLQEPALFRRADLIKDVEASHSGYISQVDARTIGETAVLLGAGRAKKGDPIDHSVGIQVFKKVGDPVRKGELLFRVHANQKEILDDAVQQILSAHQINPGPVESLPLFYGVVTYESERD